MPLVADFLAGRSPPDLYQTYLEPAFDPWARAMVDQACPHGMLLDIACGTGLVSRIAAASEKIDSIEAIDVAAPMIAKAEQLAGDTAGKTRFSVASAHYLPFADDIFDCALCQQGLQFFPDKVAGLRQARRVLKPGAKALFSTWCFASDGLPVFEAFESIIARELGSDLVPFGPFAFGDRQEIARLAHEAGFKILSLDAESRPSPLPDARTFVLFDLAFIGRPAADGTLQPILDFTDPANDDLIENLIAQMEEATAGYRQMDGSILAPMKAHVLVVEA